LRVAAALGMVAVGSAVWRGGVMGAASGAVVDCRGGVRGAGARAVVDWEAWCGRRRSRRPGSGSKTS
jgi:hypothetical protein